MRFLLNLLFPRFCISCKRIGKTICGDCFEKFIFIKNQVCPYCRVEKEYGHTHENCKEQYGIDGAFSLLEYKDITRIFIRHIKYQRIYSELEDFFPLLPNNIQARVFNNLRTYKIDYIQPIPLHKQKQKIRGFNQSQHIAQQISALLNVPTISILNRQINTYAQAQLKNRQERENNIKNAFRFTGDKTYKDKNILLVDDLFTTGSTAKEAAKELKKNGVRDVFVFTLAHG